MEATFKTFCGRRAPAVIETESQANAWEPAAKQCGCLDCQALHLLATTWRHGARLDAVAAVYQARLDHARDVAGTPRVTAGRIWLSEWDATADGFYVHHRTREPGLPLVHLAGELPGGGWAVRLVQAPQS